MVYELEIQIGAVKGKAFLQRGFYADAAPTAHFHSHKYTEIHLVSGGAARFQVGDRLCEVTDGEMLVIPSEEFHCCLFAEDSARHTAFQLDRTARDVATYSLPQEIASDFLLEIGRAQASERYDRIVAYIALFCSYFDASQSLRVQSISDYGFLIHEFFSIHYKENIFLRDLARELYLSERQTERLVLSHTGHTFRQELALTRLGIADRLMRMSAMSLTEIAEYVGYESYAGFWKAMKKYRKREGM